MAEIFRLDHTDKPPEPFTPEVIHDGELDTYWWETERQVCIPWIASSKPHRFLKFLCEHEAKGKAVVFPTVIGSRLEKLLRLRGYQPAVVWVDYLDYDADCLVLNPERLAPEHD